MHPRLLVSLAVVALTLGLLVHSASGQRPVSVVEEAIDVVLVEVPVYVVGRDGEPVRGLTRESFEVYEGRRQMPIVDFEVVDLAEIGLPGERSVHEVPAAARRHFLLMFDLIFADLRAVARARQAALDFVRTQVHPSDLVAVGMYGTAGPVLLLVFTSDRRQLELTLETLGAPQLVQRTADPLGLMLGRPTIPLPTDVVDAADAAPGSGAGGDMRSFFDAAVMDHLQSLAAAEERGARHQQENQVVALSRSMSDLAKLMGNVDGRKHLVYFSQGYDSSLLVGTEAAVQDRTAIEHGEAWRVDSDAIFGSTRLMRDVEAMLEEFRRADFTIQAIDISGLQAGGEPRSRVGGRTASLHQMARDTGGELFENFNDFTDAMERLAERTSLTYLLTVQPQNLRHDGRFRRLSVRLAGGPAGARVHHRMGYYAPDARAEVAPIVHQLAAAERILGGTEGGVLAASVLAAAFPLAGDGAYVPVLLEIDGNALLAAATGDVVTTELLAYALDSAGGVAGFFNRNVSLEVARLGPALRQSGLKYWGHFELPPGEYSIRVLVRDSASGRSGLAVAPVTVPRFGQERLLLPPLFPEPQGKWLLLADSERPQVDYPFMDGNAPFIPAAKPVMPAQGETSLQLASYGFGTGPFELRAELRTAEGRVVPGTSVRVDNGTPSGSRPQRLRAALRTEGIPGGDYLLTLFLGDASGAPEMSSSIRIRIE